ncbi:MAG: DNA polymerase IV, partial [Clostridia bacterium]|nr:DNA polymerase IV [Clostridia bacterium]
PRHSYYKRISQRVNAIYRRYTDYVEPASIDESYIDVSDCERTIGKSPKALADELRTRVREEIGITISVGVSFCKTFAKMGSDYKKPDATTVITRENFREILWVLPVSDLLYAGRSSVRALGQMGISTIGDLARSDPARLQKALGKQGLALWNSANGLDDEPVHRFDEKREIKSVSHGRTFPYDLTDEQEIRQAITMLSGEVSRSLKKDGLQGRVISVQIRRPDMVTISRQMSLSRATNLQHAIRDGAWALLQANWTISPAHPIRALTVGVSALQSPDEGAQVSLFDIGLQSNDEQNEARIEQLESAVEALQARFGRERLTLGFPLSDTKNER